MKKTVAILGSTGSIGKSLIKIILKDKKNFKIVLLTANKNINLLLKQAIKLNADNVIVKDKKSYDKAKPLFIKHKINIYNDYNNLKKIFKKKVDYSMSSIVGLDGLFPTIQIIKYTKNIAVANKEAIICGWNIIKKKLTSNKTNFIPVDSEHFSIWKSLNGLKSNNIKQIILTASGGPFFNTSIRKIKKIKTSEAIKHPNWKMGKKISVDSATMMNKVFEIIEARNIFNIPYAKLKILIHPKSYVHAIVVLNNGLIKIIAHETTMDIPIFNSLFSDNEKNFNSKKIDFETLNNLNLQNPNYKKYPILNILKKIPNNQTLYNTLVVAANDEYVKLFLKDKITYQEISEKISKFINLKEFNKYKEVKSFNFNDIIKLDKYVRFKINSYSI